MSAEAWGGRLPSAFWKCVKKLKVFWAERACGADGSGGENAVRAQGRRSDACWCHRAGADDDRDLSSISLSGSIMTAWWYHDELYMHYMIISTA